MRHAASRHLRDRTGSGSPYRAPSLRSTFRSAKSPGSVSTSFPSGSKSLAVRSAFRTSPTESLALVGTLEVLRAPSQNELMRSATRLSRSSRAFSALFAAAAGCVPTPALTLPLLHQPMPVAPPLAISAVGAASSPAAAPFSPEPFSPELGSSSGRTVTLMSSPDPTRFVKVWARTPSHGTASSTAGSCVRLSVKTMPTWSAEEDLSRSLVSTQWHASGKWSAVQSRSKTTRSPGFK
mmetsp:Transcript_8608/g.19515  ORF Transcript_8608/g.19515 Transcript_8608/m.19515 type:complete len:237 (-) Transcript_8608:255-965(-)